MSRPFGMWLQDQLDARDWKQVDLVRASGGRLKIPTVSTWIRGTAKPDEIENVVALAHALSLSVEAVVDAVLERDDERGRPEDEAAIKWRILALPANVTEGELVMLRHHFHALRAGAKELRERFGTDSAALVGSGGSEMHPTPTAPEIQGRQRAEPRTRRG